MEYPAGSELRRVRGGGHVLLRGCAVRVGSGLIDEWVRVEGPISFQKNEKGKWIPVITLANNDQIDTNVEPTTDADAP